MARLETPEGVRVVFREVDGKEVVESFHVNVHEHLKDVTRTQLRVLAEESREMILDKLYAARARPPARRTVTRPERHRRPEILTVRRRPFRDHPPLAKRTVQDKAEKDQDGRKLIRTGAYTYGIEVRKGSQAGEVYYTVRPKPGMHPDAKVTHRVLAAFHEFGTSKMPARPHWRPVLAALREVLQSEGREARAVALRRAMRETA